MSDAEVARVRQYVQHQLGGEYQLRELLEEGGAEITFRAHSPKLGRDVRLTVVELGSGLAPELFADCESAIAAGGRLDDAGIIPLIAVGRRESFAYYTTELPSGETLERVMRVAEPLPFERVVAILYDLASALDCAHRAGIVHGDMKPTDIFLDPRGRARIANLCIAHTLRSAGHGASAHASGSAAYMAPEQWQRGGNVTGQSDQFGLAAIAFEMLTGRRRTGSQIAPGVTTLDPLEVLADVPLRPGLPLTVNAALLRALSKAPAHRFPSVTAFVDALAGRLPVTPQGEPTVHLSVELNPRRVPVFAVLLGIFLGGIGIGFALPPTRPYLLDTLFSAEHKAESLLDPGKSSPGARRVGSPLSVGGGKTEARGSATSGRSTRAPSDAGVRGGSAFNREANNDAGTGGSPSSREADARRTAASSTPVGSGTLEVRVTSGRGRVLVDGRTRGLTPYSGTFAAGQHSVEVRGLLGGAFSPSPTTVSVSAGQTVAVWFAPAESP